MYILDKKGKVVIPMSTWRDYVRRVEPYTPGEQPNQPGMIKLNTNENPYPPAPGGGSSGRGDACGQVPVISGSGIQHTGGCTG